MANSIVLSVILFPTLARLMLGIMLKQNISMEFLFTTVPFAQTPLATRKAIKIIKPLRTSLIDSDFRPATIHWSSATDSICDKKKWWQIFLHNLWIIFPRWQNSSQKPYWSQTFWWNIHVQLSILRGDLYKSYQFPKSQQVLLYSYSAKHKLFLNGFFSNHHLNIILLSLSSLSSSLSSSLLSSSSSSRGYPHPPLTWSTWGARPSSGRPRWGWRAAAGLAAASSAWWPVSMWSSDSLSPAAAVLPMSPATAGKMYSTVNISVRYPGCCCVCAVLRDPKP